MWNPRPQSCKTAFCPPTLNLEQSTPFPADQPYSVPPTRFVAPKMATIPRPPLSESELKTLEQTRQRLVPTNQHLIHPPKLPHAFRPLATTVRLPPFNLSPCSPSLIISLTPVPTYIPPSPRPSSPFPHPPIRIPPLTTPANPHPPQQNPNNPILHPLHRPRSLRIPPHNRIPAPHPSRRVPKRHLPRT